MDYVFSGNSFYVLKDPKKRQSVVIGDALDWWSNPNADVLDGDTEVFV